MPNFKPSNKTYLLKNLTKLALFESLNNLNQKTGEFFEEFATLKNELKYLKFQNPEFLNDEFKFSDMDFSFQNDSASNFAFSSDLIEFNNQVRQSKLNIAKNNLNFWNEFDFNLNLNDEHIMEIQALTLEENSSSLKETIEIITEKIRI